MRDGAGTPPVSFGVVDRNLEPVQDRAGEDEDPFAEPPFDEPMPPRAPWWRWVAILVALALVVATPFAYVLSRLAPRLTAAVYTLAVLISLSRVYVGVHYPLDVLAGAVLGTLVAIALLRLLGALRRSPRPPPPG